MILYIVQDAARLPGEQSALSRNDGFGNKTNAAQGLSDLLEQYRRSSINEQFCTTGGRIEF
jgi:hypothetical protein